MHSEAMQECTTAGSTSSGGSDDIARTIDWCRRHRHTRRWCLAGFVVIPVLLGFLWLQFAAARSGSEWLYADQVCGCRDVLALWASDYVWTQMIWLPGNMLFLLIWVALAIKLWSGKRRAR
jgi:hypothetical protein